MNNNCHDEFEQYNIIIVPLQKMVADCVLNHSLIGRTAFYRYYHKEPTENIGSWEVRAGEVIGFGQYSDGRIMLLIDGVPESIDSDDLGLQLGDEVFINREDAESFVKSMNDLE